MELHKNYAFTMPSNSIKKVIIDTDAKNEADDPFAIAYALLSPGLDVRGIIATHFGHVRIQDSMQASYEEVERVLARMELVGKVPLLHGAATNISLTAKPSFFTAYDPQPCEGVDFILEQAKALHEGKLYIAVLGPLTNVASALLLCPELADRLVIVWNGGATYPAGGREFNLVNDIAAANVVFASGAEVWQVPTKVYDLPKVSLAELQWKLRPHGAIGAYLFDQLLEFLPMANENGWPMEEFFTICDMTAVGLLMSEQRFCYDYLPAPAISQEMFYFPRENAAPIRVYHDMDLRVILEDFFCKLAICYPLK